MILFEGDGHGDSDGQVSPHAKQPIRSRVVISKHDIVRDVVDGEGERMVDHAAQKVGNNYNPRVRQFTDVVAGDDLEDDHGRDNILEVWVGTHQFLDLRVLL